MKFGRHVVGFLFLLLSAQMSYGSDVSDDGPLASKLAAAVGEHGPDRFDVLETWFREETTQLLPEDVLGGPWSGRCYGPRGYSNFAQNAGFILKPRIPTADDSRPYQLLIYWTKRMSDQSALFDHMSERDVEEWVSAGYGTVKNRPADWSESSLNTGWFEASKYFTNEFRKYGEYIIRDIYYYDVWSRSRRSNEMCYFFRASP